MYCSNCGNEISDKAAICVKCGVPVNAQGAQALAGKATRVASPTSSLVFSSAALGIHNFYAGYVGRGIAQLLLTLITGWLLFPLIAIGVWVIVEVCTVKKDAKGLLMTIRLD